MMDCPRCGEHAMIYEYAEIKPNEILLYEKCMKCKTTFNGKRIEKYSEKSPFESEDTKDAMSEMSS